MFGLPAPGAGLALADGFRQTRVSALLISISSVLDDQYRSEASTTFHSAEIFPDRLESINAGSGWHGFAEQEMAISVSHPSLIELSMTLALLLALLGSLVAMGVIVKRLEQNG